MVKNSQQIEEWNRNADVVVVGFGAAGATAAITAHDAGANVLILEKAPEGDEGGNSRVSGQGWLTPKPVDKAVAYFNALCGHYTVPQKMVRVWAEEMGKNTEWVASIGGNPVSSHMAGTVAEFPELPGSECVAIYHEGGREGPRNLWKLLKSSIEERRIEILYATPGRELIQDCQSGEIRGITASRGDKSIDIKANRAVILTCGGFQNNQEMARDFLSNIPYCHPLGTPYNTGDGIKMALEVGADLWHMANMAGPRCGMKVPESDAAIDLRPLHFSKDVPGGMIVVGRDGTRFKDEKMRLTHGKMKVNGEWVQAPTPCPMFMIFDHEMFSAGPLYDETMNGWNQTHGVLDWSDDNREELAKGWIIEAATIAELAAEIELDSSTLEDTVEKWNTSCATGEDPEFGRTRMLSPIEEEPFYAIELSPMPINTQGGPRRNERSQIVRPDGSPIERLYSAGELGSIYSHVYQGCGNLGECLAFGRIAGRNAANELAWSEPI